MTDPEEPISHVDDIVPDVVPNSFQNGELPPQWPYMGGDDEDWNEQDAVSDGLPPQTPTTRTTSPRDSEGSNPPTESAADDLSEEDPAQSDFVSGPDSVTEAQEPSPEDHTQAGSSESPDDDATLALGEVAEEQLPTTETPAPDSIPAIFVTPEPNRMVQVEVAPIRMGGLVLPGGNLVLPATPAPMTPLPQQVKKPDPEAVRKQKEESLARDLRNVMKRRQPASIFHPQRPQKSSALIRSPEAAERECVLRSPQSFHALSRAGSDADGGVDAVDEGAAKVMLASPAVMKAIRDSEARRGVLREGNADER
ncbi:hypothetical protein TrVFT333_003047 [Trichoderma virens FT-333]|nr:hypothetical protein TrVFT333_003047 [Trichoderma virens FT-333]